MSREGVTTGRGVRMWGRFRRCSSETPAVNVAITEPGEDFALVESLLSRRIRIN